MSRLRRVALLICALSGFVVFAKVVAATQADLSGKAIMETVSQRRFRPFEFEVLNITRIGADGNRIVRKGRRYTRLQQGEGATNRYVLVFDYPESIRGVAFLMKRMAGGIQGHWVYLPALGQRMRRVVGGGGDGIFDTDFSVEDLTDEDFSRFVYLRKSDIMYNKRPHFIINASPTKREGRWSSHYGFRQIYIDRELYRISRIDYYDRSGALIKRRTNKSGANKGIGLVWRPETIRMENLRSGTHTTIKTTRRLFSKEWVPESFFSRDEIVEGVLLENKHRR